MYHDPELQKTLLLDWANRVRKLAFEIDGNAWKFCKVHELSRNKKTINSLKDWIQSVKVIIKNENRGIKEDIRNYFIMRKRKRRQEENELSEEEQ